LKVIDLFCGAGGFSEGFRQAGFDVIWAVDNWQPAVTTHGKNHRYCNTILGDVEKIACLPDDQFEETVPDSEIIIGSPPCVAFSGSNKSGKGDKSKGIRLIESFLRIVARKKFKKGSVLKYWILENVPNAQPFVKAEYTARDLQLEGDFVLKVKFLSSHIYKAQYFGVPSKRIRFICGDFPEPKQTILFENDLVPLKHVLNTLGGPNKNVTEKITDPNYHFDMVSADVTDHHYIQEVAEFEWRTAKRLKQDKGYMGKMSLPENVDRPARTVMATMSFTARESMIFGYGKGYRAPTIREVASLMSFPIDYRFYGDSVYLKYTLVGNAVPPKLAFAFAKAILEKEGIKPPKKYPPIKNNQYDDEFKNLNGKKVPIRKELPKRDVSRFKYHIPCLKLKAYRVELTNHHSDFKNKLFKWNVEIHKSQGQTAAIFKPEISEKIFSPTELKAIQGFRKSIRKRLKDFQEFQKTYCMTSKERKSRDLMGPLELLTETRDFVDSIIKLNGYLPDITFEQEPYVLPRPIALGYFVLQVSITEMEED
jgi:DNA (cytosine-5)-methyltransferase 1